MSMHYREETTRARERDRESLTNIRALNITARTAITYRNIRSRSAFIYRARRELKEATRARRDERPADAAAPKSPVAIFDPSPPLPPASRELIT